MCDTSLHFGYYCITQRMSIGFNRNPLDFVWEESWRFWSVPKFFWVGLSRWARCTVPFTSTELVSPSKSHVSVYHWKFKVPLWRAGRIGNNFRWNFCRNVWWGHQQHCSNWFFLKTKGPSYLIFVFLSIVINSWSIFTESNKNLTGRSMWPVSRMEFFSMLERPKYFPLLLLQDKIKSVFIKLCTQDLLLSCLTAMVPW